MPRIAVLLLLILISTTASAGPLDDGIGAFQRGDYPTSMRLLRPLAEQGNVDAQLHVAVMYQRGLGTPQEARTAVVMYRRAAEQGHSVAQMNLAHMLEHGEGTEMDYPEALKWYRLAEGSGIAEARASAARIADRIVQTRFGALFIDDRDTLVFRGRPAGAALQGRNFLSPAGVHQARDLDVALFRESGGSNCPAKYHAVVMSASGIQSTAEIGNCSDQPTASSSQGTFSIAFPPFNSTRDGQSPGTAGIRYALRNGTLAVEDPRAASTTSPQPPSQQPAQQPGQQPLARTSSNRPDEAAGLPAFLQGAWAVGSAERCSSAPYQVEHSSGVMFFRDRAGKLTREQVEASDATSMRSRSMESQGGSPGAVWTYQKQENGTVFVTNTATRRSFTLFRCNPAAETTSTGWPRLVGSYRDGAGCTYWLRSQASMQSPPVVLEYDAAAVWIRIDGRDVGLVPVRETDRELDLRTSDARYQILRGRNLKREHELSVDEYMLVVTPQAGAARQIPLVGACGS